MSELRFPDRVRYRIEIPSVEAPPIMRAVLEKAADRNVLLRRVSARA
jgi:hypothetical protein